MEHGQLTWRLALYCAYVLFWSVCGAIGCSEDDSKKGLDSVLSAKGELVGLWVTQGLDPELGEVHVAMTLYADGRLNIVQELSTGTRFSFPGTWELDGDKLILKGIYFAPDGQSQVRYKITSEGLALEDEAGSIQIWRRAV